MKHIDFKRLVLGLIDGGGLPNPMAPPRQKVFCENATWHVRDAAGRWRPQLGPDGRPRTCEGDDRETPVAMPELGADPRPVR